MKRLAALRDPRSVEYLGGARMLDLSRSGVAEPPANAASAARARGLTARALRGDARPALAGASGGAGRCLRGDAPRAGSGRQPGASRRPCGPSRPPGGVPATRERRGRPRSWGAAPPGRRHSGARVVRPGRRRPPCAARTRDRRRRTRLLTTGTAHRRTGAPAPRTGTAHRRGVPGGGRPRGRSARARPGARGAQLRCRHPDAAPLAVRTRRRVWRVARPGRDAQLGRATRLRRPRTRPAAGA
jgi:hypothetical protein